MASVRSKLGIRRCLYCHSFHSLSRVLPPLNWTHTITPIPGQKPILIPVKLNKREIFFEAYEFSKITESFMYIVVFGPTNSLPIKKICFLGVDTTFMVVLKQHLMVVEMLVAPCLTLALANVDSSKVAIAKLRALVSKCLRLEEI